MFLKNGPDARAGALKTRARHFRFAPFFRRSAVAAALLTAGAASGAVADPWTAGAPAPRQATPTIIVAPAVSTDTRDTREAKARQACLLLAGLGPGYLPFGLNGASLALGAAPYYSTSSEAAGGTQDRALWCEEEDRALWCEEVLGLLSGA